MESLSNSLLLESYVQAKSLNLSEDFIQLLLHEIEKRGLHVSIPYHKEENHSSAEHLQK
ncbi:sporulation histidine kinase inhibitor Sda [Alkalihalobacillus pseudalcaliphilus]|uniref:sporulation histidine kinase inhibitor Sda n=1 Tax=Alkalihalobacillus pseudalcaliphilus TaxID=79884 RepID=UPI000A0580BB|nr:sporulation histidine kinase inhibitor Sda [Alkalihalobacillus pseudalcaliphilus]